jgi:two-component system invasion response regulator UvrY
MIKLLLVVYPTLVREIMMRIISEEKDIKVKEAVGIGEEAMEHVAREDYDVIIVKTYLPELNGLEILRQILDLKPLSKVILLSITQNQYNAFQAYQEGAVGYISMNEMVSELISAIRKAYNGGVYISSNLAEKLVTDLNKQKSPQGTKKLSRREYEVFLKIVSGNSLTEIIKGMNVAPSTVTTLRKRVLRKIRLKNNYELIKYAIREKIINL